VATRSTEPKGEVLVQHVRRVRDRGDHDAPGHAEMDQHAVAAVQAHQDVFCPPPEADHARAREPLRQPGGKRPAHVRPVDARAHQGPALQARPQAAHHGLNLGEFRHGCA
jgi:hypothetical protein